jgi:hypothetical protein
MLQVRKSHITVWVVIVCLVIFLFLGAAPELWLAAILAGLGSHFILNIIFSLRTRLKRQDRLDRSAYKGRDESSPAALLGAFRGVSFKDGVWNLGP